MKLSYVIVTHNRREPLLKTLQILQTGTPLPAGDWETWVVDNGSTDGTRDAVRSQFPGVRLIERAENEGVWARSHAFAPAQGEYLILLDDDSYPTGDAAIRSMQYLDARPGCAAVVGLVILPDGSYEACALPAVMLSGAVCLRRSVALQMSGFRREFFRKAGEYDFSFRIWDAGYTIQRFEDVVYRHDKVSSGRDAAQAHRMDLRNNLILVERYLPRHLRGAYRHDYIQRYSALARHSGCGTAARKAVWEARAWRVRETVVGRQTLAPRSVEAIFRIEQQASAIGEWASAKHIHDVVISDFGKNIYATYHGCRQAGLKVLGVLDCHPAFFGMCYRKAPVVPVNVAMAMEPDGVVVSNINPAQIDRAVERVTRKFAGPVLRLWEPKFIKSEPMVDGKQVAAA